MSRKSFGQRLQESFKLESPGKKRLLPGQRKNKTSQNRTVSFYRSDLQEDQFPVSNCPTKILPDVKSSAGSFCDSQIINEKTSLVDMDNAFPTSECSNGELGGETTREPCASPVPSGSSIIPGKLVQMITPSDAHLWRVSIKIAEDREIRAVVDTGAARTLIHESIVDDLSLEKVRKMQTLQAIGDNFMTEFVANVSLKIGNVCFQCSDAIVMPRNLQMPNLIILGVDFFKSNCIELIFAERVMRKHIPGGGHIDIDTENARKDYRVKIDSVKCVASEDVVVSDAFSSVEVNFVVPGVCLDDVQGNLHYNSGTMMSKLMGRVLVYDGIVGVDERRLLFSSVSGPVRVKKGDVLGTISSVEVEEDSAPSMASIEGGEGETVTEDVDLSHLTNDQADAVRAVVNSMSGVFSSGKFDIGHACATKHKIELTSNIPIYERPRRFPKPLDDEINRQCDELCSQGIIEPSKSAWSFPLVPVRKSDGAIRLCIDYRKLNRITKDDKHPIPNLIDAIYSLRGVKYLSSIDLVQGYFQIGLEQSSKEYTAFSTSRNHWQFCRLPMGLKGAPSSFQRELQAILLSELPADKVKIYIDDILLIDDSFEGHLALVNKTLGILKKHGMKIKPSKCKWFVQEIEFLGHLVSESGIRKTAAYTEAITNYRRPTTVRELQSFLGFANFQRKFVPNCSIVSKPLTDQMNRKGNTKLTWTREMDQAFNQLKELLAADVELSYPDYSREAAKLELWVDASQSGAGACLGQRQTGDLKIIAYSSTTFLPNQRNYSTVERELAALRWAVKALKPFLFGMDFIIHTDHQALVYLHNMRLVNSRLARTVEDLADYSFEIRYTPGRSNVVADQLSRIEDGNEQEYDRHSPQILPQGLKIDGSLTPGGGDSLFESVFKGLKKVMLENYPRTVVSLRETAIDELLTKPKLYDLSLNRESKRRLRLMKYSGQLPCMDVLLALSRLYCVSFCVYFFSERPIVYRHRELSETCNARIYLQCLAGIHFNLLAEMNGFPQPVIAVPEVLEKSENVSETEALAPVLNSQNSPIDDLGYSLERPCGHNISTQPVISVSVFASTYCAMIDSGAEVSLVNESVVNFLSQSGARVEAVSEREIVGLTGVAVSISQVLVVTVVVGPSSITHRFLCVPSDMLPYCFLLGLDFLALDDIRLKFSIHSRLFIGDESYFVGVSALREPLLIASVRETVCEEEVRFREVRDPTGGIIGLKSVWDAETILRNQRRDGKLRTLGRVLSKGISHKNWPQNVKEYGRYVQSLEQCEGILTRKVRQGALEKDVPILPFTLMVRLVLSVHHMFAHVGRDKVLSLISDVGWSPEVNRITNDVCSTCSLCQKTKNFGSSVVPPTWRIQTTYPFEMVAVDLVSFPRSAKGSIGCLVLVDHYSKWLSVVPIRNKTSAVVTQALVERVFPSLPRVPDKLLSDNGPEFIADGFRSALQKWGVHHITTTPHKASSNGAAERVIRTLSELLVGLQAGSADWESKLPEAIISYNTTKHQQINCSPSNFILQYQHTTSVSPKISAAARQMWKPGHEKFSPYKVGDLVLRRRVLKGRLNEDKFLTTFEGPFEIAKSHENMVTYELKDPKKEGGVIRTHHQFLKPWKRPPQYLFHFLEEREPQNNENGMDRMENPTSEDEDDLCKDDASSAATSSSDEEVIVYPERRGRRKRYFQEPGDDERMLLFKTAKCPGCNFGRTQECTSEKTRSEEDVFAATDGSTTATRSEPTSPAPVLESRGETSTDGEPRRLRSRGPVADLPHVQPRILERKRTIM